MLTGPGGEVWREGRRETHVGSAGARAGVFILAAAAHIRAVEAGGSRSDGRLGRRVLKIIRIEGVVDALDLLLGVPQVVEAAVSGHTTIAITTETGVALVLFIINLLHAEACILHLHCVHGGGDNENRRGVRITG